MRPLSFLVLLFLPCAQALAADPHALGILGAMSREVEELTGQLTERK